MSDINVKLMIPIYERLVDKLPEYKNRYIIDIRYNEAIFDLDDKQEIICISNNYTHIMQFYIDRLDGIKSIRIDVEITEEGIEDVRFLFNDLNISDYQYNASYLCDEIYNDIKPYCLFEYLDNEIMSKLDFILDEFENPRSDRPYVARNPKSLYDLDLKNVKSVCFDCSHHARQLVDCEHAPGLDQALSIFKYVFVKDKFCNDTAYEMIDGKVVESNITLFEFEVSIINSMTMTKSAKK